MLEQARRSDFETFYRAEFENSVRSTTLMVGSVPAAEDIVHGAMTEIYQRWSAIREPAAYLRRSLVNGSMRWRQQRRREPAVEAVPEILSPSPPALAEFLEDLATLTPRQRHAVVLRYHDGLTEFEIAAVLRCRPGSVGPLLTRAKRTLQERWTK